MRSLELVVQDVLDGFEGFEEFAVAVPRVAFQFDGSQLGEHVEVGNVRGVVVSVGDGFVEIEMLEPAAGDVQLAQTGQHAQVAHVELGEGGIVAGDEHLQRVKSGERSGGDLVQQVHSADVEVGQVVEV